MSDGQADGANPFVGPRAFEPGEHLYGRDREARHLVDLLIAKRVVLLHSPSGAGKTSLILAKIVPMLKEEEFPVRRVMRVNLSPPDLGPATAAPNRYVMSALLCLEEALPPEARLPVAELAAHDLASYLAFRRANEQPGGFEVLVFDQFEELLTLDPSDQPAKKAFFAQIAGALDVAECWALFSIREDYVAALGPYAPVLPTRLKTTFRLDLLNEAAARQAIQGPVKEAGVVFDDDAAQKLVDDLRRTQIQQADGSTADALGPYVEPVQLQVVCRRLWQHLPVGTKRIELSHLEALGSVDLALAGYYRDSVEQVAVDSGTDEQKIRRWFEHQLITPQGIRGQVLKAKGEISGLDEAAVLALVDTHLVRGEQRRGATWYELAHDRLIEPVLRDNAAWFAEHVRLSPLQVQARLWHAEGRNREYLELAGGLEGAEAWANEHPEEMTDVERAFLLDYRQRTKELERRRDRDRRRWLWALAAATAIAGIAAIVAINRGSEASDARKTAEAAAIRAGIAQGTAEAEATRAGVAQEAAEAQAERLRVLRLVSSALEQHDNGDDELGALLARQAYRFAQDGGVGEYVAVDGALRTILAESYFSDIVRTRTGDRLRAISRDGGTIALWGADSTLRIYDLQNPNSPKILQGFGRSEPSGVVVSPDGGRVVTIGSDGVVWMWDLGQTPVARTRLAVPPSSIFDGVFSDDGRKLAAYGSGTTILLWDLSQPNAYPRLLKGHRNPISDVAFGSAGNTLASASAGDGALLWDLARLDRPADVLDGSGRVYNSVVFSPDGRRLATFGSGTEVSVWDPANPSAPPTHLDGHDRQVRAVAFSTDGKRLASGSSDWTVRLWNLDAPGSAPWVFHGHTDAVTSVLFRPDGQTLASGSTDGTVRLWNPADPNAAPIVLRAGMSEVSAIAFSAQGTTLTTTSGSATVRIWDVSPPASSLADFAWDGTVRPVAFSADGKRTAVRICEDNASASGCGLHAIEVSDVGSTGGHHWSLTVPGTNVLTLALSSDGRSLAAGLCPTKLNDLATCDKPEVGVWNLTLAEPEPRFLSGAGPWLTPQAFSPDGRYLVAAGELNDVLVWDLTKSDGQPARLLGHSRRVRSVAIDPTGQWIASASDDGSVRLWDLKRGGEPSIVLGHHTDWVWSVAFDRAGTRLATAGKDETVRIWDPRVPSVPATVLRGHDDWVNSVAFDDGGTILASAGEDGTVRFWDLNQTARDPIVLDDPSDRIWLVVFYPGQAVAVASNSDGGIIMLPTTDRLAAMVCERVDRNLTPGEWSNLVGTDVPYQLTCPEPTSGAAISDTKAVPPEATPGVGTPVAATPEATGTP